MIALVVTIIVLLILAAVAINLTIGENGIFTRAQDATEKWQEAEVNEQDEMNKAVNTIDNYINGKNPGGPSGEYNTGTTVDEAKKQNKPFEKDTTIKDDLENEVRIPGGFHLAEDSATKVEDGIVIEDEEGNYKDITFSYANIGETEKTQTKTESINNLIILNKKGLLVFTLRPFMIYFYF